MKLVLKILLIVAWIALAAGAIVLMSFANQNHVVKPCLGLEVSLDQSGNDPLFTQNDLRKELTDKFGKFEKKTLDEINLENVIDFLRKNPDIDKVDAHLTVEGKLMVEVTPCTPLVRLITNTGDHYYLDRNGKVLPVDPRYPARVVVANGNIEVPVKVGSSIYHLKSKKGISENSLQTLASLHSLCGMMETDSVLNALVEQVYVNQNGTFRLGTKVGTHIIEFGDTSDAVEKFDNLKAFYKFALPKTGWQTYHIINLTYKNQIVCTK